jgi:hypothetical protein
VQLSIQGQYFVSPETRTQQDIRIACPEVLQNGTSSACASTVVIVLLEASFCHGLQDQCHTVTRPRFFFKWLSFIDINIFRHISVFQRVVVSISKKVDYLFLNWREYSARYAY